jgi:hypothetical protein
MSAMLGGLPSVEHVSEEGHVGLGKQLDIGERLVKINKTRTGAMQHHSPTYKGGGSTVLKLQGREGEHVPRGRYAHLQLEAMVKLCTGSL